MKADSPFTSGAEGLTTEYYAILGENYRIGPFKSVGEPIRLLRQKSRELRHNDEEARHFLLHESAIEQVETLGDKTDCFRLGWLAREESGRDERFCTKLSAARHHHIITVRERENILADARFTTAARIEIEVNEGGLVDPLIYK